MIESLGFKNRLALCLMKANRVIDFASEALVISDGDQIELIDGVTIRALDDSNGHQSQKSDLATF